MRKVIAVCLLLFAGLANAETWLPFEKVTFQGVKGQVYIGEITSDAQDNAKVWVKIDYKKPIVKDNKWFRLRYTTRTTLFQFACGSKYYRILADNYRLKGGELEKNPNLSSNYINPDTLLERIYTHVCDFGDD